MQQTADPSRSSSGPLTRLVVFTVESVEFWPITQDTDLIRAPLMEGNHVAITRKVIGEHRHDWSVRWKDAARKAKAERPLYTAKPPPGFKPLDEDLWKAWHYGVNATADDPITQ